VVLVAHELGPLAGLVDRSVLMRDGRIVYDGAPLGDHGRHRPGPDGHHVHPDHAGRPHPDHTAHLGAPLDVHPGTHRSGGRAR